VEDGLGVRFSCTERHSLPVMPAPVWAAALVCLDVTHPTLLPAGCTSSHASPMAPHPPHNNNWKFLGREAANRTPPSTSLLLLLTVTGPRTALSRVLLGVACVGVSGRGEGVGGGAPPLRRPHRLGDGTECSARL
jgi:hypothetical protein